MNSLRFMWIAGEASGDTLAAELIQALQGEARRRGYVAPLRCTGAGGPRMAAAGANLALDLTAHAVVGLWEVLRNYATYRGFFAALLGLARQELPDALVLVDYPGFNLRFARAIRAWTRQRYGPFQNWRPRIIYYVSPQVWAWHATRVRQIAADVDLMLTIFPFEKDWYASRVPELRVVYVGHPLVDRYAAQGAGPVARVPAPSDRLRVLLLPGSRERELRNHLPVLLQTVVRIQARLPVDFLMVLPNEILAQQARAFGVGSNPVRIQVGGLTEAMQGATLALACSGTVTMECAFFRVPALVLYRVAWPTYVLGRLLIRVKHIAMPNLLAGEAVYPEFIQRAARADNLAAAALALLEDAARRQSVRARLDQVVASLGGPGASGRAASAILDLLEDQPRNCG